MTQRSAFAIAFSDPVPASALAVATGLAALAPFVSLGPLSAHMLAHIVLMSVVAPLIATLWSRAAASVRWPGPMLWAATVVQVVVLWLWHLPAAHHLAAASPAGALAMHASLLAAAIFFWLCVIRIAPSQQWQAILALMLTGKLVCLLAGLLVFAPRALFHHHGGAGAALADQQLAGLLMIVACPASYVLAGVLLAIRFLGVLHARQECRGE